MDSATFVAAPSLQKKQTGTPSAVSAVVAIAMIQFSWDGQFTATAGCNRLFGRQERVYPNFNLSPIGSTRMVCPTTAERLFMSALSVMNKAHRDGEILLLSNQARREMIFSRY
ncbi:MAG: META domain-containing protein [Rhodobacterales bacterium]